MTKCPQLNIRVDDAFLKSIDDWRRKQPELVTRAAAVRALVTAGINAASVETPIRSTRAVRMLIGRFEAAVRAQEMVGAMPPEDRPAIEVRYESAKKLLLEVLS